MTRNGSLDAGAIPPWFEHGAHGEPEYLPRMVMDIRGRTRSSPGRLFLGKHQADGSMVGVTPSMVARALSQPSMAFQNTTNGAKDEFLLVTGIITDQGPMIAVLKADQRLEGRAVTEVMSIYPRPASKVAEWINQKSGGTRTLMYANVDAAQVSITGQAKKKAPLTEARVSRPA